MPHFDPNTIDHLDPRNWLPNMTNSPYTPSDPYAPIASNRPDPREKQWQHQALSLSIFAGCALLGLCFLLVQYTPGDQTKIAQLQQKLEQEQRRASELDKTVAEQNELIKAQSKRLGELSNSLLDAQEDIKKVREVVNEQFREYAPFE